MAKSISNYTKSFASLISDLLATPCVIICNPVTSNAIPINSPAKAIPKTGNIKIIIAKIIENDPAAMLKPLFQFLLYLSLIP